MSLFCRFCPGNKNAHARRHSTVSAPGKVLVAGGYLVLERPNIGLVLATSARFHSRVAWEIESAVGAGVSPEGRGLLSISLRCPQFNQYVRYWLDQTPSGVIQIGTRWVLPAAGRVPSCRADNCPAASTGNLPTRTSKKQSGTPSAQSCLSLATRT